MSEELDETIDSTNDTTEEVANTEEVEEVADTEVGETEDIDAIKERLAKVEETNKKLYERTKKAEAQVKAKKPEAEAKTPEKQGGLTPKDAIALMTAKVTENDDIEFVSEVAAFYKITVSEALKLPLTKTELAQRSELRSTSEATNTGAARRGSTKLSADQILDNASKGKLPEDPEALAEARMAAKLKK